MASTTLHTSKSMSFISQNKTCRRIQLPSQATLRRVAGNIQDWTLLDGHQPTMTAEPSLPRNLDTSVLSCKTHTLLIYCLMPVLVLKFMSLNRTRPGSPWFMMFDNRLKNLAIFTEGGWLSYYPELNAIEGQEQFSSINQVASISP